MTQSKANYLTLRRNSTLPPSNKGAIVCSEQINGDSYNKWEISVQGASAVGYGVVLAEEYLEAAVVAEGVV